MAKLIPQICLLAFLFQFINGQLNPSDLILWPDLTCHEGYLKEGRAIDENGEERIFWMRHNCVEEIETQWQGDKSADCIKRCILESFKILTWRKFEFQSEEEIASGLNKNLFTYTPQTGEKIAKRILESDCQQLLTALATAEGKPSCEDQDEFINCVEKAMQCK